MGNFCAWSAFVSSFFSPASVNGVLIFDATVRATRTGRLLFGTLRPGLCAGIAGMTLSNAQVLVRFFFLEATVSAPSNLVENYFVDGERTNIAS